MTAPAVTAPIISRLAAIRRQRGMTQLDVANLMGCSASMVCHLESGRRDFRVSTLLAYCRAVGVRLTADVVDYTTAGQP